LSSGFVFYILIASFLSNYYFGTRAFNPTFSSSYNLENHCTIWSFPSKELLKKYYTTKREREMFERLKEIIPKNKTLSVQDNLLSHFSERNVSIYGFPAGFKEADYVLINNYGFNEGWFVIWTGHEECGKAAKNLFENPEFQVFFKYELVGGGIFLFGKKNYREEIVENAKRLVKSNPSSPEAHFILGSIYLHTNNIKEAEEEIGIALKLDPNNIHTKQILEAIKKLLTGKSKI
jgi:tetratricopeptide (TPR) repeat protein